MANGDMLAENVVIATGPLASAFQGVILDTIPMYGCCDPKFVDSTSIALLNFYYSKAMFTFLADGAGNVSMAPNEKLLFDAGLGESGVSQGFPAGRNMTEVESNATDAGALGRIGEMYVITGLAFTVERPYYCSDEAPTTKSYEFPIDSYAHIIREAVIQGTAVLAETEGSTCEYQLAGLWAFNQPGGATGHHVVTNGMPIGPLALMPMRAALVGGGRNSANQLKLTLKTTCTLFIGENSTEELTEDVCVEVLVQAFGYPVCAVDLGACALPSNIQSMIAAQVAAALAGR
jgi:hypothetical protein